MTAAQVVAGGPRARPMPVGLVEWGPGAFGEFPAETLGFDVKWRSSPGDAAGAARERSVDEVILHCHFDELDTAAAAARDLQDASPGAAVWLALSRGPLLILAKLVSVVALRSEEVSPVDQLTARELQVLRMISGGATNRGIARELAISLSTVNRHVEHVLLKLHARNRTEAAVILRGS